MKQPLAFNFAQGLELKADPKQIPVGKFLRLVNTNFNKGGLLQKRNGFKQLALLPDTNSTYVTTFNNNLTAISTAVEAFSQSTNKWVSKGNIQPLSLDVKPVLRSNTNQSQADSSIANGFICTVFTDQDPANLANPIYKYVVADAITGQNIIEPTPIPANGGGTLEFAPRIFQLGNWFVIVFTNHIGGTYHLQYMGINVLNPSITSAPVDITTSYAPASTLSFDGFVVESLLYVAYNTTLGGQSIKVTTISMALAVQTTITVPGEIATMMSITADLTTPAPTIYYSYYDLASKIGKTFATDQNLAITLAPVQTTSTLTILNIASVAQNGQVDILFEVSNAYSYDSSIKTNFINRVSIPISTGTPTSPVTIIRSVGLASKMNIVDGIEYVLTTYDSPFQPTYFLIDVTNSLETAPIIVSKLAYTNGGGYLLTGLPNLLVNSGVLQVPYLFKDLVTAVNKNTNVPAGTQVDGIYSQTGINYASFKLGTQKFDSVEIGSALQMSGGFLWMYDGYLPVEQNFFLFPDSVEVTTATTGGFLIPQDYFYQVVYQWTDNQGNAHTSAPSIPVEITVPAGTSTNANTVHFPTLRLTYKTANPVKAVIFRWSTAQQEYYQVTSITLPVLNDLTTDQLSFVDTLSDADILGNSLIYTTGGVVEDVNAPASNIMTLWQTRLFLVDAEDQNLIWYSKQVIEATPVEMSDLFTIYVAPTIGASGSTGPITALGSMDDKLIIFKKDAIYYVSGTGPDNTGANNLFSDPIFVTSVVGCTNQQSIINTPQGLMFQSDKGIWLLDRSLSTQYIGSPVETLALSANVLSSVLVPATNQVRFTLSSNITLVYDYFYGQWSTFEGIPGISSCIYNSLHTFLDSFGRVFQENVGSYLDGSRPVLIALTTGWLNLAGVQGYQRIYEFALNGTYFSPHFLDVEVAYDFREPEQLSIIRPTNATGVYGSDSLYGQTTPYGGPNNLEQWRIHTQTQKCQVFQISINEVFNPIYNNVAGQGLNLTGINCVIGIKKGYRPYRSNNSVG